MPHAKASPGKSGIKAHADMHIRAARSRARRMKAADALTENEVLRQDREDPAPDRTRSRHTGLDLSSFGFGKDALRFRHRSFPSPSDPQSVAGCDNRSFLKPGGNEAICEPRCINGFRASTHEKPTRNMAGKPASGEAIVFPNRSNGPVSGFPLRTFPYPFSHIPARRARLKTSAAFPRSLRNTPRSDTRGKERPLRHTVRRSEGHNGQGRKPRGGPSDTVFEKNGDGRSRLRGRPQSRALTVPPASDGPSPLREFRTPIVRRTTGIAPQALRSIVLFSVESSPWHIFCRILRSAPGHSRHDDNRKNVSSKIIRRTKP